MYTITSVNFLEYYSDNIPKNILNSFLLGSQCDTAGILKLILKPGKDFKQEGPHIIPPVRWLDSFEPSAEFVIECDVSDNSKK